MIKSAIHIVILIFILGFCTSSIAQTEQNESIDNNTKEWIFSDTADNIQGIGMADYSQFNPDKSWNKAFKYALVDLNANHSLLVYYYGSQIGQGPLRTRSEYGIRNLLDSTHVTIVDSARWNDRAFMLLEPKTPLPDSVVYPQKEFRTVNDSIAQDVESDDTTNQWIHTYGSSPTISSNWHISATKAKQNALRNLAEDLAIKISTETYSSNNTLRRYYNFSTVFSFQRIKILKRSFDQDSFRVQVAVDPEEIKVLLEE